LPFILAGAVLPPLLSFLGAVLPLLSFLGAVLPLLSFLGAVLSCPNFFLSDTIAPCLAFKSCFYFFAHLHSPINIFTYPPFQSSVMNDHASGHQLTTALYCVGAPTVAVLCECDCDFACVVQSDRKKKRVGAYLASRKVKVRNPSTLLPTIAPHSTNQLSPDDPKVIASSKQQIKKPIIAPKLAGSVSTSIVQRLMCAELNDDRLTDAEATFLALRIHADAGSLCFESTTPSDAQALAWLMELGASQAAISAQARAASSFAFPSSLQPTNSTIAANLPSVAVIDSTFFEQSPTNTTFAGVDSSIAVQSPTNFTIAASNSNLCRLPPISCRSIAE
jgi:hypothetical protein